MSLMTTSTSREDQYGTPSHCGEPMSVLARVQGSLQPADGYTTWRCFCGFQLDGPAGHNRFLPAYKESRMDETRLVAALSQVERLRWELDIATFDLRVAVEEAIQGGASPAEIAAAIDLGPDDVQLLVTQ